ncbi:AAA family ATPase [Clostridium sp.]|uniref:AAA family ATPase n=1 Tax=Clostridium sp. TaxID=1506 RepID=UPI001B3DC2C0|nr:AAA family ATPase [Clostridium sp.]MBP3917030.1 AAA family ATPase [Clostridium sp.]
MKFAVINLTKDIALNPGEEVRVEKGNKVIYDNQLIGWVCSSYLEEVVTGIPPEAKFPKAEVLESGKGIVKGAFEFYHKKQQVTRKGFTIEFIPNDTKVESDTKMMNLIFDLEQGKQSAVMNMKKQFAETRLVNISVKSNGENLKLYYNGDEVASNEIKFVSEIVPSCNGKVVRFNDSKVEVQVTYNEKDIIVEDENSLKGFKEKYGDIYRYLKSNNIKDFFIKKIYSQYKDYGKMNSLIPTPEILYLDQDNKLFVALSKAIRGKNIRFEGPRGSGKNILVDTIGWILQRPVLKLSMSEDTDKYDMVGNTTLVDVEDENGGSHTITDYEEHYLLSAMKMGCILNLDEVNTVDPGRLTILHSACDYSRSYTVPSGEKIKADPNFFVICTMNKGYVGTKTLDPAFIDRFYPIKVNYLNKIVPILMQNRSNTVGRDVLNILESVYSKIVEGINDGIFDESALSIRGFEDALDSIEDGIRINDALTEALVGRANDYFESKLKEIINMYTLEN